MVGIGANSSTVLIFVIWFATARYDEVFSLCDWELKTLQNMVIQRHTTGLDYTCLSMIWCRINKNHRRLSLIVSRGGSCAVLYNLIINLIINERFNHMTKRWMLMLCVSIISLHVVCSFGCRGTTANKAEIPGEHHDTDYVWWRVSGHEDPS